MRGKRARHHVRHYAVRIIPAHAGQTNMDRQMATLMSDHPRACGANYRHHFATGVQPGSSPRMRGKPPGEYTETLGNRIIPAHAGQTASLSSSQ